MLAGTVSRKAEFILALRSGFSSAAAAAALNPMCPRPGTAFCHLSSSYSTVQLMIAHYNNLPEIIDYCSPLYKHSANFDPKALRYKSVV